MRRWRPGFRRLRALREKRLKDQIFHEFARDIGQMAATIMLLGRNSGRGSLHELHFGLAYGSVSVILTPANGPQDRERTSCFSLLEGAGRFVI